MAQQHGAVTQHGDRTAGSGKAARHGGGHAIEQIGHDLPSSHTHPRVTKPPAACYPAKDRREEPDMQQIRIGDVTIDAVVEREGPWRRPQDFFPAYDEAIFQRNLPVMEPEVFDPASGMMYITYQTFVVRSPRHTILVDTCTMENEATRPRLISRARNGGATSFSRWVSATRKSITCSAPTSISTTPAGTPHCVTAAGCRPSRTRNTFSTSRIRGLGSRERERRQSAGHSVPRQLPADRGSRSGAAGGDDFALDDTITLTPTPGSFALPLLRQHCLARTARSR